MNELSRYYTLFDPLFQLEATFCQLHDGIYSSKSIEVNNSVLIDQIAESNPVEDTGIPISLPAGS